MFDDTELLTERAAAGDAKAMELLIERHLPSLRAYVRGRLGPELRAMESVSDVVQSTCREVLQNEGRFRHPSPTAFRRWLFTTAARKVADRLAHTRARKRDAGPTVRIGAVSGVDESRLFACYERFSRPSHRAELQDELARVEAALDRLSDEQREVLLLARVADLPRSEIAEKLGKTDVAIRSILHRALARLALELGEED